ncbi:MAG: hypothetical protein WC030_01540 [Candidatus Paceibacterota bacterium]
MSEKLKANQASNASEGKLISDRLKGASREVSSAARWVDEWVKDPVEAVGGIFDMGSQDQGTEAVTLQALVFGQDPVIDAHDFAAACMQWLNVGPHEKYEYATLFDVLQRGNTFLIPEVLDWYVQHIGELKRIFSYPESGYDRFMEMLEFLATGKTLQDYRAWWMDRVRNARKQRGEVE